MGVQEPTRRLVTGSVIVAAAVIDYYRTAAGTLTMPPLDCRRRIA